MPIQKALKLETNYTDFTQRFRVISQSTVSRSILRSHKKFL